MFLWIPSCFSKNCFGSVPPTPRHSLETQAFVGKPLYNQKVFLGGLVFPKLCLSWIIHCLALCSKYRSYDKRQFLSWTPGGWKFIWHVPYPELPAPQSLSAQGWEHHWNHVSWSWCVWFHVNKSQRVVYQVVYQEVQRICKRIAFISSDKYHIQFFRHGVYSSIGLWGLDVNHRNFNLLFFQILSISLFLDRSRWMIHMYVRTGIILEEAFHCVWVKGEWGLKLPFL